MLLLISKKKCIFKQSFFKFYFSRKVIKGKIFFRVSGSFFGKIISYYLFIVKIKIFFFQQKKKFFLFKYLVRFYLRIKQLYFKFFKSIISRLRESISFHIDKSEFDWCFSRLPSTNHSIFFFFFE